MSFFRITTSRRSAGTADAAAGRIATWAGRSFRRRHDDRDAQGRDEECDDANFSHDKPSMGRRVAGKAMESASAAHKPASALFTYG
jgi:hypothetical protein